MAGSGNLIQVEFFHIQGLDTLEKIFKEVHERAAEGGRIKTVIRFLDDGSFTSFVLDVKKAEEALRLAEIAFPKAGWLAKKFIAWNISFLVKERGRNQLEAQRLTIGRLGRLTTDEVAIEDRAGDAFRMARPEEMHDLREAASKASGIWVFVFEPNDLLSDTNNNIAYVM